MRPYRSLAITAALLLSACFDQTPTTKVVADETVMRVGAANANAVTPGPQNGAMSAKVGDATKGDDFQLALLAPTRATSAVICVGVALEKCDAKTKGALTATPGGKNPPAGRTQLILKTGLPAKDTRVAAIAFDANGQPVASIDTLVGRRVARKLIDAAVMPQKDRPPGSTPPAPPVPEPPPATPPPAATGPDNLPPPANLPAFRAIPGVAVAYDFRGTASRSSPNATPLRFIIQSGALQGKTSVRVTGSMRNLKHSSQATPVDLTAAVTDGAVDVTLSGLEPETVYRIDNVQLTAEGGNETVQDSYFAVTGGSGALATARRNMIIKALAEAYDWDHDNYDSAKNYAIGGGWCDMFYVWVAHGPFTMPEQDFAPNYFQQMNSLVEGATIPQVATKEGLHGDMVRYEDTPEGTHTFMILSYDADEQQVWTVDGNYNARVERATRSVDAAWKLGHLTAAMVSP